MGLLSWARTKLSLTDASKWTRTFALGTWAGKPVNATNALELSTWWRAVKLYAEVTGAMPLKFYERMADGSRRPANDHPVAELLAIDPNEDQTSQEFWGAQAAGLCVIGNAYAEKSFVGNRLVALRPLPFETLPARPNGDLEYSFVDRGKAETLPASKVFHTKGFGFGGDLGLSPLAFARQTLSIALATEESAGKTFAQGLRASGFFVGPKMDKTQRDDFRKVFIDPIIGNDASAHYGILENGFDFKQLVIPPKDAEMLLSRRFNVEEICRYMGIPPILVGHAAEGQTMWGTGVEAIINMWLTIGLDQFLRNIERSISKRVLNAGERRRYYAEFDRDALLRADTQARGEFYWKLVQIAAMTPNDVCDKQNFPRFDGGDVRLINSTLMPLAQAGQPRASSVNVAP